MKKEVRIPELGENIDSATVGSVLVSPGDRVRKDDSLIELESEKATLEVPSPDDGVVTQILISPGDTVNINQTILILEAGSPAQEAGKSTQNVESADESPDGSHNGRGISGPPPGEETKGPVKTPAETVENRTTPEPSPFVEPVPAPPSVRRLARELGVDIAKVKGSGSSGRISMEDVKEYVREGLSHSRSDSGEQQRPLPDFSRFGRVKREPLSTIRKNIATGTSYSSRTIPHVTQFDEADITELEEYRKSLRKRAESAGVRLTITPIIMKIAALALRRFPVINSSLDPDAGELILKEYVHMGLAVDTTHGLLVPVVRDADTKSIFTLAHEIEALSAKARDKKLAPDEMKGGSFSISNLGSLGTTHFTPVINWPEAAILGVGRGGERTLIRDTVPVSRMILPLSLSYDHRIVDGADAARFLRWIALSLEHPLNLFME